MGARSHCEDAGGRQSRRAAGVWIFLSQARLWTAAKKQAQKEVPDMGLCHCRSDATLEARWKTASATLLHRLDTPAKERHTAFYHFIKYESFFVRENLWC